MPSAIELKEEKSKNWEKLLLCNTDIYCYDKNGILLLEDLRTYPHTNEEKKRLKGDMSSSFIRSQLKSWCKIILSEISLM